MLNKSDVTLLSDAFLMLYLFFSVLFSQFCFVFILFLRTCVVAIHLHLGLLWAVSYVRQKYAGHVFRPI